MSADEPDSRLKSQKTGFIPRFIGRTLKKLKRDLDPNAESELIEEFRISQYRMRKFSHPKERGGLRSYISALLQVNSLVYQLFTQRESVPFES